jgi:hypothetical protein
LIAIAMEVRSPEKKKKTTHQRALMRLRLADCGRRRHAQRIPRHLGSSMKMATALRQLP